MRKNRDKKCKKKENILAGFQVPVTNIAMMWPSIKSERSAPKTRDGCACQKRLVELSERL